MKKVCILIILSVILVAYSCRKSCTHHNVPACIQATIDSNKNNPNGEVQSIDEYMYHGQVVYALNPLLLSADMPVQIVGNDCSTLCYLGGLTGKTDCSGDNFYDSAQLLRRVWEK